jgi:hypothetical protein
MERDQIMRRALRATCALNFGGALLFLFPDSLGRLAGLPGPASPFHSVFLAFLVALFGATYGWLARQPRIDRPLVGFCALGKAGFFSVAFACWLLGELPGRGALTASGDLLFAGIFAWWLLGESGYGRQEPRNQSRAETQSRQAEQ